MLFESSHVRVAANFGTATLRLAFPGEPVNALDLARLRELDAALRAVAACPAVRVLVVRSALPSGFCAGLSPNALASLAHPADRAAFAWCGQQVFDRLAKLDAASVAFIDGPCLGVGLELALACDHRVCVAKPTTHLGFPDRLACFGGSARLRSLVGRRAEELLSSGRTLSGREARSLGLVDVACCERRGKIELRTFLDGLERRPVKRARPVELCGLAAERRAFSVGARSVSDGLFPVAHAPGSDGKAVPPFPSVVGLFGDDPHAARFVAEAVLRGGSAVVCGDRSAVFAGIELARARGFVTPLESEQARQRVRGGDTLDDFDRVGLVFVSGDRDPLRVASVVRPRCVVCVISPDRRPEMPFPHPRRLLRVGFRGPGQIALFPTEVTAPDTLAAVAAWLKPFGLMSVAFPPGARPLPRAA
jgi:enoyl-CoA hydratase/carnithine racemase